MRAIQRLAAACLGAALMLSPFGAKADDTEIYFQTSSATGGAPLVMFYLQYTSELGSTVCGPVLAGDKTSLLNAGCGALWPLSGYFADKDFNDQTLTRFEVIRAALKKVLAPLGNMKVGLMISHDDNNKCAGPAGSAGCSNGAYILKGFTELEKPRSGFLVDYPNLSLVLYDADGNPTAKKAYYDKLDALPEPQGNLSHPHQTKEVYFELFRYLTGQGIYNAHNGWSDYATSTAFNLGSVDDTSNTVPNGTTDLLWDTSIESSGNYISPLTDNCSRVFVINIVKGSGNSSDDSDAAISAPVSSGGLGFDVSKGDTGFVEMIRWLYDRDLADGTIAGLGDLQERQNVTSFFIAERRNQVDDEAKAGGTGYALYLSDNPQKLLDTLNNIFNQILSVSTTFVSASIPVNVFNRSEVLDNVYIALFQTDPDNKPQWPGDLKKLKLSIAVRNEGLATEYNELVILDAISQPAIAPDGRIKHSALTFWTNNIGWDLLRTETPTEIRLKDGRSVNRGGAGQRVPDFLGASVWDPNSGVPSETNTTGHRQLYTEPDSGSTLMPLDADIATAEKLWPYLLGDASAWSGADNPPTATTTWTEAASMYWRTGITLQQEALNLLKFIRGIDVNDADGDGQTADVRRWIFGDPLHSRPLPINYGMPISGFTENNPDLRVIAGSNDGFVRMIRNITGTDASGNPREDGSEVWGFMPRSALSMQKKLMDDVAGAGHPYGTDGAPAAYILDKNQDGNIKLADGDKVYLFIGMRRGGHGYYALDITTPEDPLLLWSIDNSTPGFESLGLTFSTPQVRMLQWDAYADPRPVIIFGGGYDLDKDTVGVTSSYAGDDEGNAIYIVDVETGGLVWKAEQGASTGSSSATVYSLTDLVDSIPSDVTGVDTNGNGLMDRFYVGDTGGRVWRGDLPSSDRTQWTLTPVLSVGRHSSTGEDRRFFHAPDLVPTREWNTSTGQYRNYDAVVAGSGDRANPLSAPPSGVVDWIYMYKDFETHTGTAPSTVADHADLDDVTSNCRQEYNCDPTTTLDKGWRMALVDLGEKALSAPLTYKGTIYFTTYVPNIGGNSCGPSEGTGYAYSIDLDDATAVFNYDTTNDITAPPSTTGTVNDATNTELFTGDRRRSMKSGGIPSDPVFVRYHGVECIMSTDFECQQDGKKAAWRTYWYLQEE